MNKLDVKVKNLGSFKGGTIKVRPLTVLTGENGTGKSFLTKTLYSTFNIINKNLLYTEVADSIPMGRAIVGIFDNSLTRKGQGDKQHIQLLKSTFNELHSILIKIKDYPIDVYLKASFVETHTQVKNFNKFIKYLAKLEKKL